MRHPLSIVSLLAGLVAGCSDGEENSNSSGVSVAPNNSVSPPAGDLPEPCTLATSDEVAQLLDRPVADPVAESYADASLCTWESTEAGSIGGDYSPTVTIGLIQIGEANPGNRQRLDEVLALAATEARDLPGFGGVGAFRVCEDGDAVSPETCEAWDEFVLVYDSFYLEVNMSNYAWPDDYDRGRASEIVEAVAAAAAARV